MFWTRSLDSFWFNTSCTMHCSSVRDSLAIFRDANERFSPFIWWLEPLSSFAMRAPPLPIDPGKLLLETGFLRSIGKVFCLLTDIIFFSSASAWVAENYFSQSIWILFFMPLEAAATELKWSAATEECAVVSPDPTLIGWAQSATLRFIVIWD